MIIAEVVRVIMDMDLNKKKKISNQNKPTDNRIKDRIMLVFNSNPLKTSNNNVKEPL